MYYEKILRRIKDNAITPEEIQALECSEINRTILIYAYYEWNKMDLFISQLLKNAQRKFSSSSEDLKKVKKLIERSRQKNKFFDINVFVRILSNGPLQSPIKESMHGLMSKKGWKSIPSLVYELRKLNAVKKYEEELAIGTSIEYRDIAEVQGQNVIAYMGLKKIDAALAICNRPEFACVGGIQLKHIEILVSLGRIEDALAICKKSEFAYEESIQYRHIEILVLLGRTDDAIEICKKLKSDATGPIQTMFNWLSRPLSEPEKKLLKQNKTSKTVLQIRRDNIARLIGDLKAIQDDKNQMKLEKIPSKMDEK